MSISHTPQIELLWCRPCWNPCVFSQEILSTKFCSIKPFIFCHATPHKLNLSSTYKNHWIVITYSLFFFFFPLLSAVRFWLGAECLPCKQPLLFYLTLSAQRQGSPLQKRLSSLWALYFISPVSFLFVSFPKKNV